MITDGPNNPTWDSEIALANVDGYREDLREMLGVWLVQGSKLLSDIRMALANGDSKALEMALHTLRGSLQVLAAAPAAAHVAEWEDAMRAGRAVDAAGLQAELEQHIASLNNDIAHFLGAS